jgi:hypothetical protein
MYAVSAAAVFTGLREEGGLALAEAMLCGAPVIVLGNGGRGRSRRPGTDATRVALIEPSGPNETARRMGEAMSMFSRTPPTASTPLLDQAAAKRVLRAVFEQVWGQRRCGTRLRPMCTTWTAVSSHQSLGIVAERDGRGRVASVTVVVPTRNRSAFLTPDTAQRAAPAWPSDASHRGR